MNLSYLKSSRKGNSRLILIFAGWSTDVDYYRDCVIDGWDTAVVSGYSDLTPPEIPSCYKTVFVFAYSLGVFAASLCPIPAAVRIAVAGTPCPVSDRFGIPEAIYRGTAENLSERNLMKFHRRMAGGTRASAWEGGFSETAGTSHPDIPLLRSELIAIAQEAGINTGWRTSTKCAPKLTRTLHRSVPPGHPFHRAYIPTRDAIFPPDNQRNYWQTSEGTEIVEIDSPHAVDLAQIIRAVIPDHAAVGKSFRKSLPSYRDHATVQANICNRITLSLLPPSGGAEGGLLLEIGPGCGLLTEEWSKVLKVKEATFVDLYETPRFGVAERETYVCADAERWLEETDQKFDVIVSASVMQWFADPIRFMHVVREHLKPGGIAVLSTFVKGNLGELDALRPSPIIYRTEEEYRAGAPEGAEFESWSETLTFPSRRALLTHLLLTGVTPKPPSGVTPKPPSDSPRRGESPVSATPSPAGRAGEGLTYRPLIITIH